MLVKARTPHHLHGVARLEQGPQPRAGSASHKTEMTAVIARHYFEDGVGLAVAPDSQHDAFVGPLHDDVLIPRF
jgi:hypothetical protein